MATMDSDLRLREAAERIGLAVLSRAHLAADGSTPVGIVQGRSDLIGRERSRACSWPRWPS